MAPQQVRRFDIRFHETLGSTSDEAKLLAARGAPCGTVVWAGQQTHGRGRRGRGWTSPPGNLFCSVLFRPAVPFPRFAEIGFVAALAVADAVQRFLPADRRPTLKWPNDVLVDRRKIAGILTEGGTAGGHQPWVVAGIGINVACAPAGLPYPVACLTDLVPAPSVEDVLDVLLRALEHWTGRWTHQGFDAIRTAWVERGHEPGERLRIASGARAIDGDFIGLGTQGELLVRTAQGTERIVAGAISGDPES